MSPAPSHVLRKDKNDSSAILHSLANVATSVVFHNLLFGSLFNRSIKLFTSKLISGILFLNLSKKVVHPLSVSLFTTLINSDNIFDINTWNKYY